MNTQELENKEIWTLDELCAYTGFKAKYVYKLTSERRIPHYKPMGGRIFFDAKTIKEWLRSNIVETRDTLMAKANQLTFSL